MTANPRALLIARLTALLLLGLAAGTVGRLLVELTLNPEMWSDAWQRREGGPIAIAAQLVGHWFETLTDRYLWLGRGPKLVAAIIGLLLLIRTRWCLHRLPEGLLR